MGPRRLSTTVTRTLNVPKSTPATTAIDSPPGCAYCQAKGYNIRRWESSGEAVSLLDCSGSPQIWYRALKVLHEDRNAAIGWIERVILNTQQLVSIAAHLCDLVRTNTILLQQPSGRIGTISRQLPV